MSHPIHALERALQNWEDNCLFYRAASSIGISDLEGKRIDLAGPFVHFREFRSYLLQTRPDSVFDRQRFIGPESVVKLMSQASIVPEDIFRWTRGSRRAFRLSTELSTLLQCTNMESRSWADVKLPFDSFAILLEKPVITRGETLMEALLVSRIPAAESVLGHELIRFMFFTPDIPVWSDLDRRHVMKLMAGRQPKKLHSELSRIVGRYQATHGFGVSYLDPEILSTTSIGQSPTKAMMAASAGTFRIPEDDGTVDDYDLISRLVASFCLYLTTLPVASPHMSGWHGLSRNAQGDPRAVTNEALVCSVSSTHQLDEIELRVLAEYGSGGHTAHELCAHWRRGHFRRPPGSGDDPSALRTVWVRPTLVRRDRLAPGELPGGSETIVR